MHLAGAPEKAPSPKRTAEAATLAPDETGDPKMSTAEPKQTLIPTAPSGEPPRLGPSQLPPAPPPPRRSKRSRTQPPRQIPAADYAQTKWSQVTTLENMLEDIREADVATMLSLFQQAGHYTTQHGPFHELKNSLMRDQVCGPNGEPLPLPPVGNWILALGISLLGYDTLAGRELLTRLTNPQTIGDLTEAWAFQLWNRGHQSLCTWCGHGLETRRPRRCWQLPKCQRRRLHMVDLGASPRQCVHVLCHRVTAPSWGAAPASLTTSWMRMPSPQFFCLTLFQPSKSDRLCHCRFRIRISLSAHTCLPG